MDILKHPKWAIWTCRKCEAEIGSAPFEGKRIDADKYTSDISVIRTKCPVCETNNDIPVTQFI